MCASRSHESRDARHEIKNYYMSIRGFASFIRPRLTDDFWCPPVPPRGICLTLVRWSLQSDSGIWQYRIKLHFFNFKLECGPMPNVMAALSNIGSALCSTLQSLADAHYTRVLCSNAAKTRNPLKLPGVPQTNETILAASGPKITLL